MVVAVEGSRSSQRARVKNKFVLIICIAQIMRVASYHNVTA